MFQLNLCSDLGEDQCKKTMDQRVPDTVERSKSINLLFLFLWGPPKEIWNFGDAALGQTQFPWDKRS